ncbi:MAG TPA: Sir2 family NAD-dependent protein deacetylase [Streptosporangiaceae bacterium]
MDDDTVARIGGWLRESAKVTVLTGAGISTDSGIPDFRGPRGVWTRDRSAEALATLDTYVSDADVRKRSWRTRADHPAWSARPNAAHLALVELERSGKLRAIVTQNIDELHQRAGSSPGRVIEVHGTMFRVTCLDCGETAPMERALERVAAGEEDPACRTCGGILKSATISFGQALEADVFNAAVAAAADCDLFMAVGTSLGVYPVAGLCDIALECGARLVIVNAQPTPYDRVADAVVRDPIGDALPAMIAASA